MIIYEDKRGWHYKARAGLGENAFKGFYQKAGNDPEENVNWHGMRALPWAGDMETAKEQLDEYARKRGWIVYGYLEE